MKSGLGGQNISRNTEQNSIKASLNQSNAKQSRLQIIMLPRFVFCIAVLLAVLAVILLALFSPIPHQEASKNNPSPWLALSLYIQQPQVGGSGMRTVAPSDAGALIFHRALTEGPENTSRIVGKAQGFIIPIQKFAYSAFNIIYLTFNTHQYSGSLSIQAKDLSQKEKDVLVVVGGTGSFAFARGFAVFAQTDHQNSTHHVNLHLKFPNRSQTIPD